MPKATCASAGNKNNGGAVAGGTGCNCGTEALVPVSATEYCEVKATVTTGRMNAKALCTPSTAATPGSAAGGTGCLCGNDLVAVGAAEFCGIKANGNGLAMPKATCASAGNKNNGGAAAGGTGGNCGTEALVPVSATEFCEVKATRTMAARRRVAP